jgi:hypothetical protein
MHNIVGLELQVIRRNAAFVTEEPSSVGKEVVQIRKGIDGVPCWRDHYASRADGRATSHSPGADAF